MKTLGAVLIALALILLLAGLAWIAGAYANPKRAGFWLDEPQPRRRNIGCVTALVAVALVVIGAIIVSR